ncbi:MAG: MBL fold metallo-hydrolase [Deltaproteobacteria bacterium]|nr:MBL fold metallo-hydrolase [Deltaproteobacteria bacterium]
MSQPFHPLQIVDRLEVLTLMDNYVDVLLGSTDRVIRAPHVRDGIIEQNALLAEHGLSLLITVHQEDKSSVILFDTGYSAIGVPHNMAYLGIRPEDLNTVVLSHGHMDHTGSLYPLLERMAKPVALVVHPHAFTHPRYIQMLDGERRQFPRTLIKDDLIQKGVHIQESKTPVLIADKMALVTGEIERTTSFEKGMPNAFFMKDHQPVPDPIWDDQSLVLNVKNKGLVVISGCSHAGIINTVRYAKKITGVNTVYAIIGGFHLSGPFFEKIIEETILEILPFDPEMIVPMHCTGWTAIHRFSDTFPDAFVLNSVGTNLLL